jgi:putative addiction module component (TIGR02574 family)
VSAEADRLLQAALDLPEAERAQLAAILTDSIGDGSSDAEIEAGWIAQVKRRLEDIRCGRSKAVPWEEVKRKLGAIIEGLDAPDRVGRSPAGREDRSGGILEVFQTRSGRAALSTVLRYQVEIACGAKAIPRHVNDFLEGASSVELVTCAGRIAKLGCGTAEFERIFQELYVELRRQELREALERRFGELSEEVRVGVKWLEPWQIREYRNRIETAETAETVVFCTIAQKLRLEGYREALRGTAHMRTGRDRVETAETAVAVLDALAQAYRLEGHREALQGAAHIRHERIDLDESVSFAKDANLEARGVEPGVIRRARPDGSKEARSQLVTSSRAGTIDANAGRGVDVDESLDAPEPEGDAAVTNSAPVRATHAVPVCDSDTSWGRRGSDEQPHDWPTRKLDEWVSDNQPARHCAYGNAFWTYVELLRKLAHKFEATDVRVIGTYVVNTPPPREELPLPAIAFEVRGVRFAVRWDFGANPRWPYEWAVSVERRSPYLGPVFGLFDQDMELSDARISGLPMFPSFRSDPGRFSCELIDEYDLAAFIRLLSFES